MAVIRDLRKFFTGSVDFYTNDTYYGTSAGDNVYLYGGNDTFIDIAGGNDIIYDTFSYNLGPSGKDVVSSGIGDDWVFTSLDSANSYYGGIGTDILDASYAEHACRVDLAWGTAQDLSLGLVTQIGGFEDLMGSRYDDFLYGDGGANEIWGLQGNNLVDGRGGNDTLIGDHLVDRLFGGTGNDTMDGSVGNDFLYGEAGNDLLKGGLGQDRLSGGTENDTLLDLGGNDTFYGDAGEDFMRGGDGNDLMFGGTGTDDMAGNAGNDTLEGGAGLDVLNGGAGADRFVYRSVSDSPNTNQADVITDFVHAIDLIDVSLIDANTSAANNQSFTFLGNVASFSGAGQIRTFYFAQTDQKLVLFNTDADQTAEMVFYVKGNVGFTSVDFVL